jgi:exonuclease SbcD
MSQEPQRLRLLHTSDWHIGRTLCGRKRHEEFEAFLDWLTETLRENEVDVLLAAGDIFDVGAPGNRAQSLYYRFLRRAASSCRHIVVVAGNHDSPAFLDAPKDLLDAFGIHVVGNGFADPEKEVFILRDTRGAPELIVCAVPYLRDRDVRLAEAGERIEDKEKKLVDGIRDHYAAVAAYAEKKREESAADIPIVGMGHLFVAGGQTVEGDGVRELYVGGLAHVSAGIFPACFDYVALGHLHVPQTVNGKENIRYSGSPLPMGFGEARQQKSVCLVDFVTRAGCGVTPSVRRIDVPVFRCLESIRGDWSRISGRLAELSAAGAESWLEVLYEGDEVMGDLRERLQEAVSGTRIEILRARNDRVIDRVLRQSHEAETQDDLDVNDVFERCLAVHEIPEDQRREFVAAYRETLASLDEDDPQAE